MDSLIGEVFDDVSFEEFEEENMVSIFSFLHDTLLHTALITVICLFSCQEDNQVVSVETLHQILIDSQQILILVHQLT